jgi:hypothetical protein
MINTTHITAAGQAAALSPAAGVGLSLAAVGLLGGIAIAMHHKKRSPRIIGWLAFLVGIPLASLLAGALAYIAGLTLWSIPVTVALTGYIGFVFFHDGFGKKGKPRRIMQPIFGLILPALLLTLGGGLGNGFHSLLSTIDHAAGSAINQTTGK